MFNTNFKQINEDAYNKAYNEYHNRPKDLTPAQNAIAKLHFKRATERFEQNIEKFGE